MAKLTLQEKRKALRAATKQKQNERFQVEGRIPIVGQLAGNTPSNINITIGLDATTSMRYVHDTFRRQIQDISAEVLANVPNAYFQIGTFGDHASRTFSENAAVSYHVGIGNERFLREIQEKERNGICHLVDDYGQLFSLTQDAQELQNHTNNIVIHTRNGDAAEAYECFMFDTGKRIVERKAANPKTIELVLLYGDSSPHMHPIGSYNETDDGGCPHGRDSSALIPAVTVADGTYFIDCGKNRTAGEELFTNITYGTVKHMDKTNLTHIDQAKEVLPQWFTMISLATQGYQQAQKYVNALPAPERKLLAPLMPDLKK